MEACGLTLAHLFQFCDANTMQSLRRTCKLYQQHIPLGWTREYLFVTERSDKKGLPMKAFLDHQTTCRRVKQLIFCNLLHTGDLELSSSLEKLEDVSIVHAPNVERVVFTPQHRKLESFMMYDGASITELVLPSECTNLQDLTLVTLSLRTWTFKPEWSALQVISFTRVGHFPTLILPSSYTSLEHLHLSDVRLERLELHMDLTRREVLFDKLSVRIYERNENEDHQVQIVTDPTNRSRISISSNCAMVWSP